MDPLQIVGGSFPAVRIETTEQDSWHRLTTRVDDRAGCNIGEFMISWHVFSRRQDQPDWIQCGGGSRHDDEFKDEIVLGDNQATNVACVFRYDFTITKWYRDNELHNPSWPLDNPNPHGHDWPDIKVAFQWRAMPERPSPNGTLIARVVYSDSSSTGSPFPVGDNQGHANIEFILERSIAIGPAAGGGGHGEWPHG